MPIVKKGYCTLCRSRCGTLNTVVQDQLVSVAPDTDHPTGQAMCLKGRAAPELVHNPNRILTPMRRTAPKGAVDPGWEAISWEEALDEITQKLSQIRTESGPEAVVFGVTTPSGTPLSDSIDWIERFVRAFGSPNIAYGTEVCNWHKDHAHEFTYGCGIPVADYEQAELIMLWGHNPVNTWLAQAHAIANGRAKGAQLLVIDPRKTALAAQAECWLPVRPGTDAALALGLIRACIDQGGYDAAFIRQWTNAPLLVRSDTAHFVRAEEIDGGNADTGWVVWDTHNQRPVAYDTEQSTLPVASEQVALTGAYELSLGGQTVVCHPVFELLQRQVAQYTPEVVAELTGVPAEALQQAAQLLSQSRATAYHAWSGVAQSDQATQTERAIAILYALTGSFDKPGGNRLYTKHPSRAVNGLDLISDTQRAKALGRDERPLGPPATGWITALDMYQAILTAQPYRVRAFFGFGTNQLSSQADVDLGQAAFEQLEFHVHCDLYDTPTARYADIFLPVNTPWEREGLRLGFEINQAAHERIQWRPQMVPARGASRSDNEIVFELAGRLGMGALFFEGSLERAWDYQLAPLGLSVAQLRAQPDHSVRVPTEQVDQKYTRTGFATPTRRVELYSERLMRHGYAPLPHYEAPASALADETAARYPLVLTSAKSGYYCHSQHRGAVSLRKRAPYPTVMLHPDLARSRGVGPNDWVQIETPSGAARFVAVIDAGIAPDTVCAEYGWWQAAPEINAPAYGVQGPRSSNYNSLISAQTHDPISGSIPMRGFSCELRLDPLTPTHQRPWEGTRPMRVQALRPVTADVLEITLACVEGEKLPDYQPGQHISLTVAQAEGQPLTRNYSLVGPARLSDRAHYQIAVRHQTGVDEAGAPWQGKVSSWLHQQLGVGDVVQLGVPKGLFVMPEHSTQPVVLIAGGIGITPFMAYLQTLAQADERPEVWLYYANRSPDSTAYETELAELEKQWPELHIHRYYDAPVPELGIEAERISAEQFDAALIKRRARFYICGPKAMMDALRSGLVARGVPNFDIFTEVFRSPPVVSAEHSGPFEVCFVRSEALTVPWRAASGTLLDLGEKSGLSLPSGCRAGQCESCAVRVISGEVLHLDGSVPEDPEMCLTCQAIPLTDLVLDA